MLLLLLYWCELHNREYTDLRSSVHPQPTRSHPYIFSTSRPNLMLLFACVWKKIKSQLILLFSFFFYYS